MPEAVLSWEPHPDAWLLVVALVGGYLYALSAWGPKLAPGRRPASRNQRVCFVSGVALLWVAADWPIHHVAESYLFSVHMLQHMIFLYAVPALLILGTPGWLLRRLLRPAAVFAVARVLTRPLVALVAVNAFIAATHWPVIVNASVQSAPLHFTLHAMTIGLGVLLWWPVLSPLPELPHLSYPGRMTYLFAHSIVPTVPASFLTFSEGALYRAYAEAPRLWDFMTVVQDQQIAGLLMKIGGGLILWGTIAVLFFRWASESESGGPDALYWRDLEGDIEAVNLQPTTRTE
ncbi:MAG TPA: cytochrome c oxidase assembly protein [Egibacteraceae bacterium]|jgi:putative membrane protein|nr:cytochrome c oxidase assembly protein [Egibacteraceae bacterium]